MPYTNDDPLDGFSESWLSDVLADAEARLRGISAQPKEQRGKDPQEEITALRARVTQLETELATLIEAAGDPRHVRPALLREEIRKHQPSTPKIVAGPAEVFAAPVGTEEWQHIGTTEGPVEYLPGYTETDIKISQAYLEEKARQNAEAAAAHTHLFYTQWDGRRVCECGEEEA